MSKKSVYKPKPVSGFPEFLPQERRVEQQWLDHIRRVFESYGYCSIETPAVEELDILGAKGGDGEADVDKEVYVIERLHKEEGDKDARLALHFDQTVPLARYVAQHFNDLDFPFKRYQMQKVWRGERPQAGRFREFMQCDIDVINVDTLPLHFDAEAPAVIWETLTALPGMENENIQIRISNRKILMGLLDDLGVADKTAVTRVIDKVEKIGKEKAAELLETACSLNTTQTESVFTTLSLGNKLSAITPASALMEEGVSELSFVMDQLAHLPEGAVIADLSIVRGLDYYTGTVYETVFTEDPGYGSICSGGRYDDLAGNYINKNLPGVGISIGFTRLFDRLRQQGKLPVSRTSPADILVLLMDENQRVAAMQKAKILRDEGFNVETYHAPQKIQKQFAYAEKKGIPFVFVPMNDEAGVWEVKDMSTREQRPEDQALEDIRKISG